jgi:hypothetical protein
MKESNSYLTDAYLKSAIRFLHFVLNPVCKSSYINVSINQVSGMVPFDFVRGVDH